MRDAFHQQHYYKPMNPEGKLGHCKKEGVLHISAPVFLLSLEDYKHPPVILAGWREAAFPTLVSKFLIKAAGETK